MINDYRDILDLMKSRRRELATHLEYDDEAETCLLYTSDAADEMD